MRGPRHLPPSRRRRQAHLSQGRFQAPPWDIPATVERLEYDPNRTAFIALIKYKDGQLAYIIAPQRLAKGDTVVTSATADIKPGNVLPLKNIPVGTIIHNIEMKPQKGAQMVRSAAPMPSSSAAAGYAQIKLSSGEVRMVPENCLAAIGAVSNPDNMNEVARRRAARVTRAGAAMCAASP